MKNTLLLLLATFLAGSEIIAQKVKDEDFTFKYKRLPSNPISKKITSYAPLVVLAYEEEEKQKADDYQAEKKQKDEKYAKEKQAQKEKSFEKKFVDKVILGEKGPQKENVEKPFTKKIFDKELLASYIKLEGYEKSNASDLKVTFIAHGIEWQEPKIDESTYTPINSKSGPPEKKYITTIKYRSPVSIKVETAEGKEILNETIEKTNEYLSWTSEKYNSKYEAEQKTNPEKIIPSLEQKAVEESMKNANQCLNDKCATSTTERKIVLYNVESKKGDYSDFQKAYLEAMEGYTFLIENPDEATKKLQSAIAVWDKAMKESNPKDKKARVNEEITIAAIFNLAEAYMWTNDFTKAKLVTTKASVLDLSRKENKRMDELKLMIEDHKQRFEANKGV